MADDQLTGGGNVQAMPDPYEEAKRLTDADIVLYQRDPQPVVVWKDDFAWRCQVCGWNGYGLSSQYVAQNEAGAHMKSAHPEMGKFRMEVR